MKKAFHVSPTLRSVGVISAVAVLVGGVTFAALQGRATLTDNTISSASAGLLVDGNGDGTFSEEEPGFAFEGIVPGVTPSEAKTFALQNSGETDLKIKAMVKHNAPDVPEEPTDPATPEVQAMHSEIGDDHGVDPTVPDLPEGVEASDIVFTFTPEGGEAVDLTWEQLASHRGKKILNNLAAGESATFTVQVSLDESVNVSSVDIGSFDIVFTGKAIAAPETPEEPAPEEPGEETPAPEVPEVPAEEEPAPAQ